MFDSAISLFVSKEDRLKMDTMIRSGGTSQQVARKCRIVLLAGEGVANSEIARRVGVSRPTVIGVRAAYVEGGVEVLAAKGKRNRSRSVLTLELEQRILDTTLKSRPPDATQWSVRSLAEKAGVSRMMVHRVWKRYDIQPHRVEKFKLSRDPLFEEKVRDVVGLYLNPPERALVLCLDEKSQIQALADCSDSPVATRLAGETDA